MRINTPFTILNRAGFITGGGTMTGPLILPGHPVEDMEAATKNYVDTRITSLNVSAIVSGVFPLARFPAFGGDLRVESGLVNLTPTGVAAGRYVKVVVDNKGRVTGSGGNLLEADIPALSWSKITTGKPNTLAGYGITEALPRSGGTMTGPLLSNVVPHSDLHVLNKAQVDSELNGYGLEVGDIIRKAVNETPPGFLRCNGGLISKTTYANLYNVLKEEKKELNVIGAGKPWRQQYDFNTVGDSLGAWTTDTSLPRTLGMSQAIVTSSRVYLLGGRIDGSSYITTVYTAPINGDGTLGAWTTDTNSLPVVSGHSQAIVTKNRVYLLGGWTNNNRPVSDVYTAPINEDGTLGPWATDISLPGVLGASQAVVTSNRVYLLGGNDGSGSANQVSTVYTAPINEDGTLGAWTTDTSLPQTLCYSQAVVTSNRVYLLGGTSDGSDVSTVYTAPINGDGTLGAWTTYANSLPGNLSESQTVVTSNRVYLLGGRNSGNSFTSDVYTAPINEDGTLGTWATYANSLPGVLGRSHTVVTSSRVYLLGGNNVSNIYVSTVYTAPINEDGTLGAWSTDTSLPQALAYSQVVVTSNRVYLLGGHIGGSAYNTLSTVYTATFSGGKNDYSEFYDGSSYRDLIQGKFDTISHPGNGKPWRHQYSFNESTIEDITDWREEANLPRGKDYSQAVVTKNRVYLISGNKGGAFVETAPILPDGTIGAWTEHTPLPTATYSPQVITTKNKLYVLGGYHHTRVYSALIKVDGTLDEWVTEDPLPANISHSQAIITKNRVHLLGGHSGSVLTYTAQIYSNGNIGPFYRGGDLLRGYDQHQAIVVKNKVHILGGNNGSNFVDTAEILEDGTLGLWRNTGILPRANMRASQAITTSNRVWLLGNFNTAEVYTSAILPDGSLSGWLLSTPLPIATTYSQVVITSSRVYILGGYNNSNRVFSAPFPGGRNDYSEFYNKSFLPKIDPSMFMLPDITQGYHTKLHSYIKY